MEFEPFDWYATPLYYDIIFDVDTQKEAGFLAAVSEKYGRSGGKTALEPACGTGRLLEALAERGFGVSGFDAEPAMVRAARDRLGKGARVWEGWFEDFMGQAARPTDGIHGLRGKVDLMFCLVSSFKYVLDEEGARAHLREAADWLAPGGVYVLGLHLTDYTDRETQVERWRATRDGVRVDCTIKSWPADRTTRLERVRSRLTVQGEGIDSVKRYESCWDFRTYGITQLRSLLRSEPRLRHVATYTFHHEIERRVRLGGEDLGVVLVLRRE
ncbi:MAG: class I SAM-dependent methyltransferase [Planctomycetota bacterium]